MICIDTDVLAIYHVFNRDARYPATHAFMERSKEASRAVAIFSLLEVCGVVATARQSEEAMKLFDEYLVSDDVRVLYPPVALSSSKEFWTYQNVELLERIERGMRLGDAAVLWAAESNACDIFVTWNTKHFAGKTTINVQTPAEWLEESGHN